MKKIIVTALALCLSISGTASAFEIKEIGPDTSFIDNIGKDVSEDIGYLSQIANAYKEKYVVSQEKYADISDIDNFYNELSTPITLEELDSGSMKFGIPGVYNEKLKKELVLFNMLGGMSGCRAEFEPVAYFRIYRNITLVGGYTRYVKTHLNADDGYWQYICGIENLTKEIVPYETRINILNKTRQMYCNMDSDNRFKIFLLVDGKINSVWERGESG